MAFRMQSSVPELIDISNEPKHVLDMYGPEATKPGTFAASCLLARRMAERDVRFVQIFHRGWDQHGNIAGDLPNQCHDVDQPCHTLVQDLKQRDMLDDTLVVWGGEFGRTIYCQGKLTRENYGRDHHPRCFTIWMAGGGVKQGIVYGDTAPDSETMAPSRIFWHDSVRRTEPSPPHRRQVVRAVAGAGDETGNGDRARANREPTADERR